MRGSHRPTPPKHIIILRDFGQTANEYFVSGKENYFPRPEECPFCKNGNCCLIGHGFYKRWVITPTETFRIPIKIFKCKNQPSGGYISLLPDFCRPHCQYSFQGVYEALKLRLLERLPLLKCLQRVFTSTTLPYQLLQSWIKKINRSAELWAGILAGEITGQIVRPLPQGEVPVEAEHLMLLLEVYFNTQNLAEIERKHALLVNRYRGSPLGGWKQK